MLSHAWLAVDRSVNAHEESSTSAVYPSAKLSDLKTFRLS